MQTDRAAINGQRSDIFQVERSIWLEQGVDYTLEFGTGGAGGDAGWDDWDEMEAATANDGETSTVWSSDPTDPALGGTADPVSGVKKQHHKIQDYLPHTPSTRLACRVVGRIRSDGSTSLENAGNNTSGTYLAIASARRNDYDAAGLWRRSGLDQIYPNVRQAMQTG